MVYRYTHLFSILVHSLLLSCQGQLVYAQTMDKLRGIIRLILWAAAAAFAAIRVGTADVFILGAIEGLMVLIAAFVAHKTLDLIFPQKRPPVDQ